MSDFKSVEQLCYENHNLNNHIQSLSDVITELEHKNQMFEEKLDRTNDEIEQSANGHNAWPMDVEQSTKIKRLEDDVRRIEDHYLSGK